jgi:hypothetical protein
MKTIFDFAKKMKSNAKSLLKQLHIDIFEFESTEIIIEQEIHTNINYGKDPPRDTVIGIACSKSMSATDYWPTRFKCGINAAIEYMKVRARQNTNDRVALVCFSNETRLVVHLVSIQDKFTIQHSADEANLRGSVHIGKGLKGVIRVFKKQKKPNHQRHVILLTDSYGGNTIKKAEKLKYKYGAIINVVAIGRSTVKINKALLCKIATTDPDGNNHFRFVKDPEDLIEHFGQLAAELFVCGKNRMLR